MKAMEKENKILFANKIRSSEVSTFKKRIFWGYNKGEIREY